MTNNEFHIDSYFAAANGYNGFESYFKQIFYGNKKERVYILKGGPGTGKSSLMKKIAEHFEKENYSVERIYCSSDPFSLDGIILKKAGKAFSILDGTPPHESDVEVPGARDEIVNLGEAWNKEELTSKRKEIEGLVSEKAHYYKNAYEYLSIAGEFHKKLSRIITKSFDKSLILLDENISKLSIKNSGRTPKFYILSSFGKDGYRRLDTKIRGITKIYSIEGNHEIAHVFLSELSHYFHPDVIFISPFSKDLYEGLIINDTMFFTNYESGEIIKVEKFLKKDIPFMSEGCLDFWESEKELMLKKAKEEFSKASYVHFNLEKIYTRSMNFKKNDKLCERIIKDISEC